MSSKPTRTLVKTISWRILATSDTFLIAWLITGKLDWAGAIAGIEVVTKMFLYYMHERAWTKIKWGKKYIDFPTEIFPSDDWKIRRLKNYLNRQGHKRLAGLLK
jgi:uncharacterized membrane protein|tara:strand:- start:221 stop:532 length:312 start_codon:yes stop_codon:yes gene_type:complete